MDGGAWRLHSPGLQKVVHDLATKNNNKWLELRLLSVFFMFDFLKMTTREDQQKQYTKKSFYSGDKCLLNQGKVNNSVI